MPENIPVHYHDGLRDLCLLDCWDGDPAFVDFGPVKGSCVRNQQARSVAVRHARVRSTGHYIDLVWAKGRYRLRTDVIEMLSSPGSQRDMPIDIDAFSSKELKGSPLLCCNGLTLYVHPHNQQWPQVDQEIVF